MRFTQPTADHIAAWAAWVADRPEGVRRLCDRFDPWTLYRLKTTGQRVTVCGFNEAGTVTVNVTGEFNFVGFERSVFGIDPDDLEECDLPGDDELLGTLDQSIEEVKEFMKLDPAERQRQQLAIAKDRPLRTYPRSWKP